MASPGAVTLNLDTETATRISDFTLRVATTAEHVIYRSFPEKILSLQQLADEAEQPGSDYDLSVYASNLTDTRVYSPLAPYSSKVSVEGEPEPKRRKRNLNDIANGDDAEDSAENPGGAIYPQHVKANIHLRQIQDRNKREFEQLVQYCDKIKLWINLTMPRIEDGDNFGVQIQEDVIGELTRAQESAYNLRDMVRSSHMTRAKLASKLIKYPNVEDYVMSLKDHDEKQLYLARQHIYDIRNVYAILFDILHKNIAKLRAPKGNNSVGMY